MAGFQVTTEAGSRNGLSEEKVVPALNIVAYANLFSRKIPLFAEFHLGRGDDDGFFDIVGSST